MFSLYYVFEVITTVGYGDFAGHTTHEYLFLMCTEFIGLIVFSFLMNSVSTVFSVSNDFSEIIEHKMEQLDIWIKKVEKSNWPFHIHPSLYDDIRNNIEQAIYHDFNMMIEDFDYF